MLSTEESNELSVEGDENTANTLVEVTESCPNNGEVFSAEDKNDDLVEHVEPSADVCGDLVEESEASIDKSQLVSDAETSLKLGKFLLATKEYSSAVDALLCASSKFCQVYGELADECGDAYFYYGCALLELGISGDEKSCDKSERKVDVETKDASGETCVEEMTSDNCNTQADAKVDTSVGTLHSDLSKKEGSKDDIESIVQAGDFSDKHLAREMLELAKFIFVRQNDNRKLINVYSKLSSLDMSLGNYTGAIINSKKCLTLQEKQVNVEEREIADTFLQLGMAYLFANHYYVAVKNFTSAGAIYKRSIRRLLRMVHSMEPDDESDSVIKKFNVEINDMKSLLQNITDKICDAEELIRESMKTDAKSALNITIKVAENESECNDSVDTVLETRANVISHLLKRKREVIVGEGSVSKKPRINTA